MKHNITITIILLSIFLFSQYLGIFVVNQYIDTKNFQETGEVTFEDIPLGERPELQENTSYIPVIIAILIGTFLILMIIKLGAMRLWKAWFALALFMTMTTSIGAFTIAPIAIVLAIILTAWRIFKNNPIIHNLTEPFVYAGIAAIFVPVFNLLSISILLVLISIYDAYAVWKSKHMIALAKAQKSAGIFAGLQIPSKFSWTANRAEKNNENKEQKTNSKQKEIKKKTVKSKNINFKHSKKTKILNKNKIHHAILGGGDIAFPLLFAGVLLKEFSLTAALILPIFSLAALSILFYFSKKGKFYPAMPFISSGCFLGFGFLWVIGLI